MSVFEVYRNDLSVAHFVPSHRTQKVRLFAPSVYPATEISQRTSLSLPLCLSMYQYLNLSVPAF